MSENSIYNIQIQTIPGQNKENDFFFILKKRKNIQFNLIAFLQNESSEPSLRRPIALVQMTFTGYDFIKAVTSHTTKHAATLVLIF